MAQTVYDVGDQITSRLALAVTPDGTTAVTATLQRPDGTAVAVTPSAFLGAESTFTFYATDDGTVAGTVDSAAGDWLAVWKVTGTGAGVTPKVYNVAPLPGATARVSWSPFLSDVADHVPYLSIDPTTPGVQTYLGTFTAITSPTDEQAQRHIDRATAIVGAGFSTLTGALPAMARSVAAIWAAATLCRAFARDAETVARAADLMRQAQADLKILQNSVDNASESTTNALPVLRAPDPVSWGDTYL